MANITLLCAHSVYVYQPKLPLWRRNNTILSVGTKLQTNNSRYNLFIGEIGLDAFNIVDVTYADDGIYTCFKGGARAMKFKLSVYSK